MTKTAHNNQTPYGLLNDYSEGAHPSILDALVKTNTQQHTGYGTDIFCEQARQLLQTQLNKNVPAISDGSGDGSEYGSDNNLDNSVDNSQAIPSSAIHFITGGTQANLVCLDAILRPVEAVICASSGHIAVNEAGAIESTGHKVITAPTGSAVDGKLTVSAIEHTLKKYAFQPHVVRVKAVYISNTTELGTVYQREELAAISACCRQHGLYLFMDGARLGAALASTQQDLSLADIAHYVDMFWLGGTKMGAMFGEMIVIPNPSLRADFAIYLKQHGALLAKGRMLGIQFVQLLQDNLYLTLCQHANQMATQLSDALTARGYSLLVPTQSNQVFAVLDNQTLASLKTQFAFYEWEKIDNQHTVVRLVTSWATEESKIEQFVQLLSDCSSASNPT